jgi:hypothetical protein
LITIFDERTRGISPPRPNPKISGRHLVISAEARGTFERFAASRQDHLHLVFRALAIGIATGALPDPALAASSS